jgi:hypothetical protein
MPYVSAKYAPPGLLPPPEGSPKAVTAIDDEGNAWALTEDSQVGDWLNYIEGGGTIDPADPVVPPSPWLQDLNRATAIVGSIDVPMTCIGSNFTDQSVIVFDGVEKNTTFLNDAAVTCVISPAQETAPRQVDVLVRDTTGDSNILVFTFIEGT